MRIRLLVTLIPVLGLVLLAGAAGAAAPAKARGISKSAVKLTPSERAGIPPEAFGSPVASPDKSFWVWIADFGDGPNLFVADSTKAHPRALTHYKFTPASDLMPGLPIRWSPDGRYVAYYEYSHGGGRVPTSSHAVVAAADGSSPPVRVLQPGKDLNTRPTEWLSGFELRFKGLREASLAGGEDAFVFDLHSGLARTEAEFRALKAAQQAAADSAARAAAAAAAPAAPPVKK